MGTRFLAVLSASALLLAAFGPAALAQDDRANAQYVDCSQVQLAEGNQGQYAAASSDIAQELNITQEQVNECLGGGREREDRDREDRDRDEETTVVDGKTIILDDVAADQLPKTGGASFSGVVLASGCALLGAGLLVNRFFR